MHFRMTISLIVVCLMLIMGVGGILSSEHEAKAQQQGGIEYFALGDSVASGHGLLDDPRLSSKEYDCRRSKYSYPYRAKEILEKDFPIVKFVHRACSGDTSSALARQVDTVMAGSWGEQKLVTITIGANDFHWTDFPNLLNKLYVADSRTFTYWVYVTAALAKQRISEQVDRLVADPNTAVVLTEYYNPMNRDSFLFRGPENNCFVYDCYARTQFAIRKLNEAIHEVRNESSHPQQIAVAEVYDAFIGHESPSPLCGKASPGEGASYIQYPDDRYSNSYPDPIPIWLQVLTQTVWKGDCFHPNMVGALVYAQAVARAARTVLPSNPVDGDGQSSGSSSSSGGGEGPSTPPEPPSAPGQYWLPWQAGSVWKITCGNNDSSCLHSDVYNRFAFTAVFNRGSDLVVAARDGTVVDIQNDVPDTKIYNQPHGGNCVLIDHGGGYYSMYAHLAQGSVPVQVGQKVAHGAVIGRMGNSGFADGKQLEWAVGTDPGFRSSYGQSPPSCSLKTVPSTYAGDDAELIQDSRVPRAGRYYDSFNLPPADPCPLKPVVIKSLSVTPGSGAPGDRITATFTVKNEGCSDFRPALFGAGGRGPGGDSDVQDFDIRNNVVIAPGGTYEYTTARSFDRAGSYKFFATFMDSQGGWHGIPATSGQTSNAALQLNDCTASPILTKSLVVTPNQPTVNGLATATFTLKNTGCREFRPMLVGAGGRGPGGDSDVVDFPLYSNVVVPPGGTYQYSAVRTFPREADYGFGITYRDQDGIWHGIPAADGVKTSLTIHVGGCGPQFLVTTSLVVTPKNPMRNEPVTATFTVTNTGCQPFTPSLIGAGGRGPGGDPDVQDFPLYSGVVIPPGGTYSYTATRGFNEIGQHGFNVAYRGPAMDWHVIPAADGLTSIQSINVTDACLARPVVTSTIALTPEHPAVGENVTATVTFANAGCAPFEPNLIGVGVRGPAGINEDMNWASGVVIPAGQTYVYTASRTFDSGGTRSFFTGYRDRAGNWLPISAAIGGSATAELTISSCSGGGYVTNPVALDPIAPRIGETITATFTVTNTAQPGCASFKPAQIGVRGNGPSGDGDNQDFPMDKLITIAPGQIYTYSATRSFDNEGEFSFVATYQDDTGAWLDVPLGSNVEREATATIGPACVAEPVIMAPLRITPENPDLGEEVTASTTIANGGCVDFAPAAIAVIGRGPGDGEAVQDFAPMADVVIPPGGTYDYSAVRTFDTDGVYTFSVGYQDGEDQWVTLAFTDGTAAVAGVSVAGEPHVSTPDEATVVASPVSTVSPTDIPGPMVTPNLEPTNTPTAAPTSTSPFDASGPPNDIPQATTSPTEIRSPDQSSQMTGAADVVKASASSQLVRDVSLLTDGDPSTAWVEGVPGPGIGESITLTFAQPIHIRSIVIVNGFAASDAAYAAFNAVSKLQVTTPDGGTTQLDLAQTTEAQEIPVDLTGDQATFTILAVFPGSALPDDTAIAEIQVMGTAVSDDAVEPTVTPTLTPTPIPTSEPTATATPTAEPTAVPTATPTTEPTATPTSEPTAMPTATPTSTPTPTPEPAEGVAETTGDSGEESGQPAIVPVAGSDVTEAPPEAGTTDETPPETNDDGGNQQTTGDDGTEPPTNEAPAANEDPDTSEDTTDDNAGSIIGTGDGETGEEPAPSEEPSNETAPPDDGATDSGTSETPPNDPVAGGSGQLAYGVKIGAHWDIYLHDFASGGNTQLTNNSNSDEWAPAWSHDGGQLAYLSDATDGSNQVWLMQPDGTGQTQITDYHGDGQITYVAWSADDQSFILTVGSGSGYRLMKVPTSGGELVDFVPGPASYAAVSATGQMVYVVDSGGGDTDIVVAGPGGATAGYVAGDSVPEDVPSISSDGARVAYNAGAAGHRRVMIASLDGSGGTRIHGPAGDGSNPVWSPDGSRIAYVWSGGGENRIVIVPVDGTGRTWLDVAPHDRIWYLAWRP